MDNLLSVYQHPTLTVLIDDNQSFLDSLSFRLSQQLACRTFNNPRVALDWLRQSHQNAAQHVNEPIRVGFDEETDSFERRNASIDMERIYRMVTNRHRFDMPTVLVVDYTMPQMNGIEFFEAVQDLPCKKILLTGQADDSIAVNAFNRKLINCFIKKSDPDVIGRLESEIAKLQKDFFIAQSSTLKDLLSRHSYAFLTDPAIALLVEQLKDRYQFVEYYLFPNPAGILFVDMQGKATLMVVATEDSLTSQFEVAQDQDAPPELLAALREFRLVPFFSDTHGAYLCEIGDDWLQYCLPPQICRGRQNYFWALFDLPSHYLQTPVYSYEDFLQNEQLD